MELHYKTLIDQVDYLLSKMEARRHIAAVIGADAIELEIAALNEAREVFGERVTLFVLPAYVTSKIAIGGEKAFRSDITVMAVGPLCAEPGTKEPSGPIPPYPHGHPHSYEDGEVLKSRPDNLDNRSREKP